MGFGAGEDDLNPLAMEMWVMCFIWGDLGFWCLGSHRCHESALLWGFSEGKDDPSSTSWLVMKRQVLVKVRLVPTQPVGYGDMGGGFYLGRFGVLVLGVP